MYYWKSVKMPMKVLYFTYSLFKSMILKKMRFKTKTIKMRQKCRHTFVLKKTFWKALFLGCGHNARRQTCGRTQWIIEKQHAVKQASATHFLLIYFETRNFRIFYIEIFILFLFLYWNLPPVTVFNEKWRKYNIILISCSSSVYHFPYNISHG